MHACSRSSRGGENGFEPPFLGRFWVFFALGNTEKAHVSTRSTHWPLCKTPFALWCLPLAPYIQAREKHIRQELAGFWRLGL